MDTTNIYALATAAEARANEAIAGLKMVSTPRTAKVSTLWLSNFTGGRLLEK
jgi:hypothetical protein